MPLENELLMTGVEPTVGAGKPRGKLRGFLHQSMRSKLLRNILTVVSGTAGAQAMTMAFMPVITRLYGPEAYGILGIRVLWFQRRDSRFLPPSAWSKDAMATTTTHDLPTVAGWWKALDIEWRARLGMLGPNATESVELDIRNGERSALWQAMSEAGVLGQRESLEQPPHDQPPVEHALAFVGMIVIGSSINAANQYIGAHDRWAGVEVVRKRGRA